jgi:hypothetical protein
VNSCLRGRTWRCSVAKAVRASGPAFPRVQVEDLDVIGGPRRRGRPLDLARGPDIEAPVAVASGGQGGVDDDVHRLRRPMKTSSAKSSTTRRAPRWASPNACSSCSEVATSAHRTREPRPRPLVARSARKDWRDSHGARCCGLWEKRVRLGHCDLRIALRGRKPSEVRSCCRSEDRPHIDALGHRLYSVRGNTHAPDRSGGSRPPRGIRR